MKDIIAIVFFAKLAKADEWIEIYLFAVANEKMLREYLEPPAGILSHDTIERVSAIISIVMTRNTIHKGDTSTTETRYFISSLPENVEEAARAIRGHWMVESYHWHLDVTFREDANHALDDI